MQETGALLLSINTGSSSLKLGVYRDASPPEQVFSKSADAFLPQSGSSGQQQATVSQAGTAIESLLGQAVAGRQVAGVGHRLVHGGVEYREPCRIDEQVRRDLDKVVPLAPNHLPQALAAIDHIAQRYPAWPQVACFDTAFHRTLPRRARSLGLPGELTDAGVIRFGFHGLSYEYLVTQLRQLDPENIGGRAVMAHLGNGASMAAVERGTCLDTSMGFTPAGGLMMGTRSGDIDPGVLVYLLENRRLSAADLDRLVNKQSGLLGVSGSSADMRQLLERRPNDERADAAVERFCYQAKKFLAGYAAALGGLDTVVFTGGIGEHSPAVREEICRDLAFLGLRLDRASNAANKGVISDGKSAVVVRIIPTNEDLMIACHTQTVLKASGASST